MKNFWQKLIITLFIFFIVSLGIYLFILPPQAITVNPLNQAQDVAPGSPLIIKFDKPVKRQLLNHFIIPEAYGEWKFEDPLIKNHLYRNLVFIPAVDFKPDTEYQVKIENITSPLGVGLFNSRYSFSFKTRLVSSEEISQNETQLKETSKFPPETSFLTQPEPKITLLNVALDWQDHPLSCEAASLKMALTSKGVYISENDIMKEIGYDPTPHQGNIWGDPDRAYVGNIDGKICNTGYGVHWQPVAKAANEWREAEAFSGWNLKNLIKEIELGNPVIVWGTLPVQTLHECSWYTPERKYIKTLQETHVRLVVGFIGESENPSKIILNDPLAGRLYWPTSYFLTNWKIFGYSGVLVR